MYLRCPKCLGTFCIRAELDQVQADCPRCKACLALGKAHELGATGRERTQRAETFAKAEGIDLASSYSVLLGLLELEQVRSIAAQQAPTPKPPPAARRPAGPAPVSTSADAPSGPPARRARSRPGRVPRAQRRAGGPDGTKSLELDWAAILKRPEAPPPRRTIHFPLIVVIVALLLSFAALEVKRSTVALGWEPLVGSSGKRSEHGRATPAANATKPEILRDSNDRPTRVTAGSPGEVLRAFCSAEPERIRMPVEVRPSIIGLSGVFQEDGNVYAIEIREEGDSGRWYSGDARTPLEGRRAEAP